MIKKYIKKIPGSLYIYRVINFIWGRFYHIVLYYKFFKNFLVFKKHDISKRFVYKWSDRYPCLWDKTTNTAFDRHYVYHPAWAARVLAKISPSEHIDISSTLHFCSIVSAFIPIKFYDFRPAQLHLSNLYCGKADLTELFFDDNSIESLSCMHTVEHIGLGRYGDPIDPDGDIKAMQELQRVLKKDGNLLFVVPIGKSKIMFNAHRIYSYQQIIDYFSELKLKEFALIPDSPDNGFITHATPEISNSQYYGCGCFWFTK